MPSFNRVLIMGHLTRDPATKHLSNDNSVTEFGVACNRKYKTAGGEEREDVLFIDCAAFGKTGDVIAQYMSKGKPIFLEGRLKLDTWEAKDGGGKRSKISIIVENFQFIGSKSDGDAAAPSSGGGGASRKPAAKKADQPFGDEQVFDESEIPF